MELTSPLIADAATRLGAFLRVAPPGIRPLEIVVTREHSVFADDDGVVFLRADESDRVLQTAREIHTRERAQADRVRGGVTLAEQFRLRDYIAARERDPGLTFRAHLRALKGEIEI
jgi:hypothetical protein